MRSRVVVAVGFLMAVSWCVGCAPELEDHWNNADSFAYPEQAPTSLDVLSYNVFLRPRAISSSDETACRGEEIGALLANRDADVVALQESWERHGVDALVDESESALPFRVLSKPRPAFRNISGGLSILSRWPIEDVRTHRYSSCYGEDCLASKGILQAVIRIAPSERVNVVTTHLDSGNEPMDRRARASQLDELQAFLAGIDPSSGPVLLVGDFNVDGVAGGTEYEKLISSLRANEDFERGESTVNCETNVSCVDPAPPKQLDYVLTLSGESRMFRYQTRHLPLATTACGGEVNYLSDHRAVSRRSTSSCRIDRAGLIIRGVERIFVSGNRTLAMSVDPRLASPYSTGNKCLVWENANCHGPSGPTQRTTKTCRRTHRGAAADPGRRRLGKDARDHVSDLAFDPRARRVSRADSGGDVYE